MSNYAQIKKEIQNLPATWIPALLQEMVIAAEDKGVFVDGGIENFVKGVVKKREALNGLLRPEAPRFPRLTAEQVMLLEDLICPDCGKGHFLGGPSAGLSVNIKCANPSCGSEFNDTWFNAQHIKCERISHPRPNRMDFQI